MTEQRVSPAATLILYRDTGGAAEHLFVERSAKMAFAAGALVFPGGRVDPDDHSLAARYPELDPDDAAARIAAIRETLEEAGIIIGVAAKLAQTEVESLRAALAGGALLSEWLDTAGHMLDLDALTPWARWLPNHPEARVFDTRFYIAAVPQDAHPATVDETENVHLFWATAGGVIARAEAGTAHVIFPTMRNLERLASVPRYADALAHAITYPVKTISPFKLERDGETYLAIADDAGYPITEQLMSETKRAAYRPSTA